MSVSINSDGPTVRVGNRCPANGRATVAVEVVMSEEEQCEMMDRIVDGQADVDDREQVIEALGLATVGEGR
jgi:hypothetical protein